jgi:hypothetical protein
MTDAANEVPNESERPADALPEDLDVTAYVGPYRFPNIKRRRLAALLYAIIAAGAALGWWWSHNIGLLIVAGVLLAIAAYHLIAGWNLAVDEIEALAAANRAVGFPIGHASAQLGWVGLRSRPVWRVLCYSADEPPSFRGLVQIDGVDGHLVGEYIEQNPEDWSKYADPA